MTPTDLSNAIAACRLCVENPRGAPLPHAPRPVVRLSSTARILIAGQAPGTRVHATGAPFNDASGDRLRDWMGVDRATFYDAARIAISPMGFCFPGQDAKGGDLPPRRECAPAWRDKVMASLTSVDLVLAIGIYAQRDQFARLGVAPARWRTLSDAVADWRAVMALSAAPRVIPLPHPSWRNTGWLKRRAWFEAELLPVLRAEVAARL